MRSSKSMFSKRLVVWASVMVFGSMLAFTAGAAPAASPKAEQAAASVLEHGDIVVNGVRLHYIAEGQGEPVLLLHGWPQSAFAWRHMRPLLVKAGRRVYAVEYRGAGRSEKTAAGYDIDNLARDIHAFIEAKQLNKSGQGVDVVAHDVGTWIGHALAANHPGDVKRLVLSEALLPAPAPPGGGIPSEAANLRTWQFSFNRLNDLPEALIQGNERAYLSFIFETKSVRGWKIDPAMLDQYVREYQVPGTLRAGFDLYRVNFSEAGLAQANARAARKVTAPMLAVGGGGGIRDVLLKSMQPLATDVQGAVLDGCGHFLPDECPDEFVQAINAFWASRP